MVRRGTIIAANAAKPARICAQIYTLRQIDYVLALGSELPFGGLLQPLPLFHGQSERFVNVVRGLGRRFDEGGHVMLLAPFGNLFGHHLSLGWRDVVLGTDHNEWETIRLYVVVFEEFFSPLDQCSKTGLIVDGVR